ncbi:MAG: SprT-like domain-containing protein [Chitinophagaceae bacterium]|nr:SprT-like domain-containing protein [Chitinophagaceae bacterium]
MHKKQEAPLSALQAYIPEGTEQMVMEYLQQYKVHLTITRERKSILGDYRFGIHEKNHRISVNGNLNPFAFLITLLHELAHLVTFVRFGNRVAAHGKEWKAVYGEILHRFLLAGIFPEDIAAEIKSTMHRPAAGSCAEDGLMRVLRRYDPGEGHKKLVEELEINQLFRTDDGRVFKRGNQLRKRIRCIEMKTNKIYLFSPVYEVIPG